MHAYLGKVEALLTTCSERFYALCNGSASFIIFAFGGWQLLCTALYLAECNFNQVITATLWFATACLLFVIYLVRRGTPSTAERREVATRNNHSPPYWWGLLAVWLAAVMLYWITKNYTALWVLGIATLVASFWSQHNKGTTLQDRGNPLIWKLDAPVVLGLALFSALIALTIQSVDGDVAFTLSIPVSLMDFRDLPILSFDGMHRDLDAPLLSPIYIVQSYEVLVAAVADLTGIAVGTIYYLAFPALFAALIPVVHWLLLRDLFGPAAVFGVCISMVALVVWGNSGYAYGSYTYTYIFLSKATISVVWIPLLIFATWRYVQGPSAFSWLQLLLCQAAAICISSSALVLAPLLVGVTLLALLRWNTAKLITSAAGLATTIYPLLLGIGIYLGDVSQQVMSTEHAGNTEQGLRMLFGEGPRLYLGLFALLAAAIIPGQSAEWRFRFGLVAALLALVFNPLTGQLLSEYIAFNLYWRVFWIVPMPLLVGAAAVAALRVIPELRPPYSGIAAGVLFILGFAMAGNWAITPQQLGGVGYKVIQSDYQAVAKILPQTQPSDLAIFPEHLAVNVPSFHNGPRLLVAREHYLEQWSGHLSPALINATRHLLLVVNDRLQEDHDPVATAAALNEYNVTVVVIEQAHSRGDSLTELLEGEGYRRESIDRYWVFKRAVE